MPPRKSQKPTEEKSSTEKSQTSFDFGDYNAAAEEGESRQLSWRDDPERSLSDWTIVVRCGVTGVSQTFNVHKAMLAAGAQPSEYFKSVFVGGASGMREGSTKTTTLDLENSAAVAFPAYLDFVYTGVLGATSASATALLHLAGYLRCRELHNEVTQFMQGDLCGDNAALYLAEAERYSLEKVAAAALPVCAAWLTKGGGGYVTALPSPLFCRVIHAPERECSSGELSQLVAAYCCGPHAQSVDGAFLTEVTAVEIMPVIDSRVALSLMERAWSHEPQNASSLRERCVRACALHWQSALLPAIRAAETPPQSDEAAHRPKRQRGAATVAAAPAAPTPEPPSPLGCTIPEAAKVKLLAEALKAAADELESVKAAAEAKQCALDSQYKQTNASLSSTINQTNAQLNALSNELRRFKRIPITETMGGLVAAGDLSAVTYSAGAETDNMPEPVSPRYRSQPRLVGSPGYRGSRKYGSQPPASLPTNKSTEKEGWVHTVRTPTPGFGSYYGSTTRNTVCAVYYFE